MHTIQSTADATFDVVFYQPDNIVVTVATTATFMDAAALCSHLNGGLRPEISTDLAAVLEQLLGLIDDERNRLFGNSGG